ncbi:hypothetical protein DPMN_161246 [Dreissena polymorpha]|uniref:Uncharacterized protein n=1 Tax=Dreissena polymorpha TaxID=45954 RepID=A0A9D4ENM9_DREPO|nr:hypothetical protein DPMN_161246 [Dreissena polymorpha]
MKFFSSTLSKAGSSSSITSSINNGRPSDKESSRWERKYLWFRDVNCTGNVYMKGSKERVF